MKTDTPDMLRDIKPSTGAATQLAAIGPEDKYITIDPTYSPFKYVYKKHTQFAVQQEEGYFGSGFMFGRTCPVVIGLRGDLVNDGWLEIRLPVLQETTGTWVPWIGYAIIKMWRLYIGESLVQTCPREWAHYMHVARVSEGKLIGLDAMVGKDPLDVSTEHTLFVPMPFFFSQAASTKDKNPLPICALSNASSKTAGVRVEVDVESFENLVNKSSSGAAPNPTLLECTALFDYVLLADEERTSFVGFGNRILFKTVLSASSRAYSILPDGGTGAMSSVKVRMGSFNLPVASIMVVAGDENAASDKSLFTYKTIDSMDLFLTSQKRFDTRPGSYFSTQQAYSFGQRVPKIGSNIYTYAFTLPWVHGAQEYDKNDGHVDLGRAFSEPTVRVNGITDATKPPCAVTVFAECYSFLTCEDGFASVDRVG